MAQHLLGHDNVFRVSPAVAMDQFALDDASQIAILEALGSKTAAEMAPKLHFLFKDKVEPFVPVVADAGPRHPGLR